VVQNGVMQTPIGTFGAFLAKMMKAAGVTSMMFKMMSKDFGKK
jgi:hypothetical protein